MGTFNIPPYAINMGKLITELFMKYLLVFGYTPETSSFRQYV